jgi:hypothetical protein
VVQLPSLGAESKGGAPVTDTAVHHYRRAQAFLADFERSRGREDQERHLAAAVENAVAIAKCFRGSVPDGKLQDVAWKIPRYRLLKRVRIHNFHRRAVPFLPADLRSKVKFYGMQGPISLRAGPGPGSAAWLKLTPDGPVYGGSGGGAVVRQPGGSGGSEKDIVIIDGKLWDDVTDSCVALDEALRQFLNRVPGFLDEVQQLL